MTVVPQIEGEKQLPECVACQIYKQRSTNVKQLDMADAC